MCEIQFHANKICVYNKINIQQYNIEIAEYKSF